MESPIKLVILVYKIQIKRYKQLVKLIGNRFHLINYGD